MKLKMFVLLVIGLSFSLFGARDLSPVKYDIAPIHPKIELIKNGKILTAIVTPEKMSPSLLKAVKELAECLEKISGGSKVKILKKVPVGNAIIIGNCIEAEKMGLKGADMPIEGFCIKTAPRRIFLVGNNNSKGSKGTEWAIYDFCERILGVRWYFVHDKGGRSIIAQKNLSVSPFSYSDAPYYSMRTIWPSAGAKRGQKRVVFTDFFRVMRANNAHNTKLLVHAPTPHVYAKEYAKTAPEIFQLRSDGIRNFNMLCYGNPKTLEIYMKRIAEERNGIRKSGFIIDKAITVSPNDAQVLCSCKDCKKMTDPKGGQYGTASRIMTNFVKKLSKKVAAKYPDMTIIYLPYLNYVSCPTGTKFDNNVEVQLCSMPGLALFKEPVIAKLEQQIIDDWFKATNRKVQNWHYLCWPEDRTSALYYFPQTIIKFYKENKNKVIGSFINGTDDHSQQNLSIYFWLKALWNPNLNQNAIIDEYCKRMYGAAVKPMRKLIQMQIDGWEKNLWNSPGMTRKTVFEISYPRKDVVKMEHLLKESFALAENDKKVIQRLKYYAIPFKAFFSDSKNIDEGTAFSNLMMQKAGENPTVDGKLDEAIWQRCKAISFVRAWDKNNKFPQYPTRLKATWTPDGVTFGFIMSEPLTSKLQTKFSGKDSSNSWSNDNIEIFIDVTGQCDGDFYQFIIDSVGGVYDAHKGDISWNCKGLKTVAFRGKNFWSMEVFIPFSNFKNISNVAIPSTSGAGLKWMGNFTRHRVVNSKTKGEKEKGNISEYTRMNTTYANKSSNLSDFAELKFIE